MITQPLELNFCCTFHVDNNGNPGSIWIRAFYIKTAQSHIMRDSWQLLTTKDVHKASLLLPGQQPAYVSQGQQRHVTLASKVNVDKSFA